jgi:hypothetical protein
MPPRRALGVMRHRPPRLAAARGNGPRFVWTKTTPSDRPFVQCGYGRHHAPSTRWPDEPPTGQRVSSAAVEFRAVRCGRGRHDACGKGSHAQRLHSVHRSFRGSWPRCVRGARRKGGGGSSVSNLSSSGCAGSEKDKSEKEKAEEEKAEEEKAEEEKEEDADKPGSSPDNPMDRLPGRTCEDHPNWVWVRGCHEGPEGPAYRTCAVIAA